MANVEGTTVRDIARTTGELIKEDLIDLAMDTFEFGKELTLALMGVATVVALGFLFISGAPVTALTLIVGWAAANYLNKRILEAKRLHRYSDYGDFD